MYSTTQQGAVEGGVWMATDWYGSECVLRVAWAKNNDADRQTSTVRSGQSSGAGRAGRQGGGRNDVSGNRGRVGALWNRAGGRMSLRGCLGEGGAAGVTLLLGCLAISCAPACGLDDR